MLPALRQGLLDIVMEAKKPSPGETKIKSALRGDRKAPSDAWLSALLSLELPQTGEDNAATIQLRAIQKLVAEFLPWLQPRFSQLMQSLEKTHQHPLDFYTPETTWLTCREIRAALTQKAQEASGQNQVLANELLSTLANSEARLTTLIDDLKSIAAISDRMFQATDYQELVDPYRRLLTIGYDTEHDRRLESCYDLLASEARTAMFLAIAKGDALQDSWFRVGRKTTMIDGNPVLLSWSGTMFEYMMPTLWMQTSPGTLLAQSLPGAVRAQREYVARQRIPWGISEASHSLRDAEGNYQYHAFGVPTLAINPPPEGSMVIAPYATVLALEADPVHALANLHRMEKLGWLGEFGFYESADYSDNVPHEKGSRFTLVRSWMAHHQGMSLLAITNVLEGKAFQRWFHSDPRVRATELLLHEKPVQIVPKQETPHAANVNFHPTLVDSSPSA